LEAKIYINDLVWTQGTQFSELERNLSGSSTLHFLFPRTRVPNFIFHRTALGLAENKAITTKVDWVPQKAAYLIDSMMSCGAVVIDEEGIVKISCDESNTALLA